MGVQAACYVPVFYKSEFSLGVEFDASYFFSNTQPALIAPLPVIDFPESTVRYESNTELQQDNFSLLTEPRFTFSLWDKLQLSLSPNVGLMF